MTDRRTLGLSFPSSTALGAALLAAAIAGCGGPDTMGGQSAAVESNLLGDVVENAVELVPLVPSRHSEKDAALVEMDPDFVTATETEEPFVESFFNPCMNESGTAKGVIKTRIKVEIDDLTLERRIKVFTDTRGVAATATFFADDDGDPWTPMKQFFVGYHNTSTTIQEDEIGPAQIPFESELVNVVKLRRDGNARGVNPADPGDDFFFFLRQRIKIDRDGVGRERVEIRQECK